MLTQGFSSESKRESLLAGDKESLWYKWEPEDTRSRQGENRVPWALGLLMGSLGSVVQWLPAPGLVHVPGGKALAAVRHAGIPSFTASDHRGKSSHHVWVSTSKPPFPDLHLDMASSGNQVSGSLPFHSGDRTVFTLSAGQGRDSTILYKTYLPLCVCEILIRLSSYLKEEVDKTSETEHLIKCV